MIRSNPIAESDRVPPTGLAVVLVREIAARLATFVATGEAAAIDLRSLPMTDGDRRELETILGQGDVSAILTVAGTSEIWETAISGVWWVRHRSVDGHVASEEIVVAHVPDILTTQPDDARDSLARLRSLIENDGAAVQSLRPLDREFAGQTQGGQ